MPVKNRFAELLPEIEAVMVRKLNEQMEGRRNG